MNVSPVPIELSCLNDFEKILIQRAKCFMTVVKLKPYRYRGPSNSLIKAKKGTAVHFKLPPGETVNYVAECERLNKPQVLPSSEFVDILVDSVPTNKNVIWRSVVEMKNVVAALNHLKENGNPLYKNVSAVLYNGYTCSCSHSCSSSYSFSLQLLISCTCCRCSYIYSCSYSCIYSCSYSRNAVICQIF